MRIFCFLFIGFSALTLRLSAQLDDSSTVDPNPFSYDSSENVVWTDVEEEADQDAPADSSVVTARSFSGEQLNKLKEDDDFNYEEPPSVGASLWDRLWAWFLEFIASLFDKAFNTNWGNIIVYTIGIVLLVVLVMTLLKVNAFRMLYGGGDSKVKAEVLDENIHEMDFDQLIQEAIQKQDYRRGIRLLFLYSLKLLADKHLIHWENGKTNHEYVAELQQPELKPGFNELSFYFDYAWYGNFKINADTFGKAESIFKLWKQKVN